MENDEVLFQLKSSFVAWRHGIVSILVHVPVTDPSSKLRLHKLYASHQSTGKTFPVTIESEDKYLAINPNLRKCTAMRDKYLCNDVNLL